MCAEPTIAELATADDFGRFMEKVAIDAVSGCWNWTASKTKRGYARFWFHGKVRRGARLAYQMMGGEIARDEEADHLCENEGCVNPAHIEPVSPEENKRRQHARRLARADRELAQAR